MKTFILLKSLEVLIAPPKAKRPSTLNNGPPKNPIGASSATHTSSPSPKISKVEIESLTGP